MRADVPTLDGSRGAGHAHDTPGAAAEVQSERETLLIVSMGFILNEGSYLRDAWNILDFTFIASGYMGMFMSGSGANLSVLRSFRVFRLLRTISSVQGLRIIVASLINVIPLLRDSSSYSCSSSLSLP
jgi:hypothetical protein